jgi:hypothetical protein
MIISLHGRSPCNKDIKFQAWLCGDMADAMFMFSVTAGIFAFLVAVCFGARAKRYSAGYTPSGGHAESSG